jgi:hypothetical protein
MTVRVGTPYVSTAPAISHLITFPAASPSEMIVVFIQTQASQLATIAGFTQVANFRASGSRTFDALAKVADGGESSATVSLNVAAEAICHTYVISGSHADLSGIYFSAPVNSNGFEVPVYNPPALTPAGGLANYNWFALIASRIVNGFTEGPTSYTSLLSSKALAADDLALGTAYRTLESGTEDPSPFAGATNDLSVVATFAILDAAVAGPDYTQRKGGTFDATHTIGTITTATLNAVNVFDHVSSQAAGTISFTGAITDERTTSGVVDLVLGDGAATQTQTVQVNVFGVVPSNNPAQKDGAALASLTGVQIRITAGANLNGTQVYYSGTEATDASGNFNTLDVSTSAAVAADPVRMQVLTAAGDSITSAETVGLI